MSVISALSQELQSIEADLEDFEVTVYLHLPGALIGQPMQRGMVYGPADQVSVFSAHDGLSKALVIVESDGARQIVAEQSIARVEIQERQPA